MVDGAILEDILQKEGGLLEQMIGLEEETQYLLVRGDAGKLKLLNTEKEKLVLHMAELEEQRKKLFSSGITLEEYLVAEEPQNRRELEDVRKLLLQLHASLQKKLKINRYLLRHNLQFTRLALNFLFPGEKNAALYASSGRKNERKVFPAGLIDSNA